MNNIRYILKKENEAVIHWIFDWRKTIADVITSATQAPLRFSCLEDIKSVQERIFRETGVYYEIEKVVKK